MSAIEIRFGSHTRHVLRFEEGSFGYQSLTLIVEQLNPFLPSHLADEQYDIHILSTETSSGEIVDGIRISKLVDEGKLNIRLLDPQGQPLNVDPSLLNRMVLVGPAEKPPEIVVHPPENASDVQVDQPSRSRAERNQSLTRIKIRVWEAALIKAREHAQTDTRNEVGGICMGILAKDRSGQMYVEITDTFRAEQTINQPARITFTSDTWSAANRVIDRDYEWAGERMVGWYHTHPGYGIFLSSYDLFIHENFFTQSWHIALVIDPLGHTEGFFAWDTSQKVQRLPNDHIQILPGSYTRKLAPKQTTAVSSESPVATVSASSGADTIPPIIPVPSAETPSAAEPAPDAPSETDADD